MGRSLPSPVVVAVVMVVAMVIPAHCYEPTVDLSKVQWIHGCEDCGACSDEPIQTVRFSADTYVLRQSMCVNFEGPFLYLLFGNHTVLLYDSGATADPLRFPIRAHVEALIEEHARAKGLRRSQYELLVAHTHAHGDHVLGDGQFDGAMNTTVVGTTRRDVERFFGFERWPDDAVVLDLGGRALLVLAIPGHEASHLAVFDPHTGALLTGDTLYPGWLFVEQWAEYRQSVMRLASFAAALSPPPTQVLGAHIEMTSNPRRPYPYGSTYQPHEHVLPLPLHQLLLLNETVAAHPDPPTLPVITPSWILMGSDDTSDSLPVLDPSIL